MMDLANVLAECACLCENKALENACKLLEASKKRNFIAVQVSPAARVMISEKFAMHRGEDGIGKLVTALEILGADVVVDTAIASDILTLLRLKEVRKNKEEGKGVAVYSSECSAWVAHAKEKYPAIEILPTATTVNAKLLKKYYGSMMPDKKIRVIAVEVGEVKKQDPGVDVTLTVNELAQLLDCCLGLKVRLLKKSPLETPFGVASGAAYIQAVSGGDAEALARCLTKDKTQLNFRKFEYSGLYGKQDCREVTLVLDGTQWDFAVVDSLAAADELIASGKAYDYVEVTAVAGGQIGKGCDLSSEDGKMTRRLRKLGLKYLDFSRAARSADTSSAAEALLKTWNALCRNGEEAAYDVIDEIVDDPDEPVIEEPVEEVVEEVSVEEPVEEVVEEAPVEEPVEEVVEEVPVEEPVEEVVEEVPVEEPVEEVVEEAPVEEPVEEVVEEVLVEEPVEEVVEEVPVEEPVFEEVAVEDEPAIEAVVEENVEEPVFEEVAVEDEPAIEAVVEESAEESVIEEVAVTEEVEEEVEEEIVQEDFSSVTAEELAEEMKHVEELLDVAEEDLTLAQRLARAHYYRRLSTRERRKLKRARKKNKNGKK